MMRCAPTAPVRTLIVLATCGLLSSTALAGAQDAQSLRELISAGQLEEAEQQLGALEKGGARLPGVRGALLEAKGDNAAAVEVYLDDLARSPANAGAAAVRVLRLLPKKTSAPDRVSKLAAVALSDAWVGRDVLVADEVATSAKALGMSDGDLAALLAPWVNDLEPPRDAARREAHGRLVEQVALHGAPAEKGRAVAKLYVELAETQAAKAVLDTKVSAALRRHKDRDLAIARAEVLLAHHDNDELLTTLARHRPKAKDVSEAACHVRYLRGKANRNKRRYQAARADLDVVSTRCAEPYQMKARYLAARVASFAVSSDAHEVFDRFLSAYPDGSLTDDVLDWKAKLLKQEKRFDEADAVYARIATEHADGDMFHRARFDRAFLRAERGDAAGAIALLDEIARTSLETSPIVSDQALYWRARLKVFPELLSWQVGKDAATVREGWDELVALASSRPASFYGHLALTVINQQAVRVTKAVPSPARPVIVVTERKAHVPTALTLPADADDRLRQVFTLLGAGYAQEAALVLDGIDKTSYKDLTADRRVLLARLYAAAGRPDRTHQVMRHSGHALLAGKPDKASIGEWVLGYPLAYQAQLSAAATEFDVPPLVMQGLSREESAFEAEVISWAGAIGLCQLMPYTAKEEAQLIRYKGSVELPALREPTLNARLGSAHLGRRWKGLKHPFLAIAAYNAGPGNVNKWLRRVSGPVDTFVESIPVEQTRNYVKKVTGSWVTYTLLDPDGAPEVTYGLEVPVK
jgi:soluble lytic murein transglycosylase